MVAACHNGENRVTISGPKEAVDLAVVQMKEKDIFVREVDSAGVAFHSHMLQCCAEPFRKALQKVFLIFFNKYVL